jgi:hypothetical protein
MVPSVCGCTHCEKRVSTENSQGVSVVFALSHSADCTNGHAHRSLPGYVEPELPMPSAMSSATMRPTSAISSAKATLSAKAMPSEVPAVPEPGVVPETGAMPEPGAVPEPEPEPWWVEVHAWYIRRIIERVIVGGI